MYIYTLMKKPKTLKSIEPENTEKITAAMSEKHDDSCFEKFFAFVRLAYFLAILLTSFFDVEGLSLSVFLFLIFYSTGFLSLVYFIDIWPTDRLHHAPDISKLPALLLRFLGFEKWLIGFVLLGIPLDGWMGWNVFGHMDFKCFLLIVLPVTSMIQFLSLYPKLMMTEVVVQRSEIQVADELKEVKRAKAELEDKYAALSSELSNANSWCQSLEDEDMRRKFEVEIRQLLEERQGVDNLEKLKNELQEVMKENAELEEKCAALSFELSITKSGCKTVEAKHRKCEEERQQLLDQMNKQGVEYVDKLEEVKKAKAELEEEHTQKNVQLQKRCQELEAQNASLSSMLRISKESLRQTLKTERSKCEEEYAQKNVQLQKHCRQLETQNASLSSMLRCSKESVVQTLKAERSKCEEERRELMEDLKKATHASEIYRGLLHDFALDYQIIDSL